MKCECLNYSRSFEFLILKTFKLSFRFIWSRIFAYWIYSLDFSFDGELKTIFVLNFIVRFAEESFRWRGQKASWIADIKGQSWMAVGVLLVSHQVVSLSSCSVPDERKFFSFQVPIKTPMSHSSGRIFIERIFFHGENFCYVSCHRGIFFPWNVNPNKKLCPHSR